jgi:hypothetical protein
MIFTPEILSILILDLVFLGFATVAFILSLKIFFKWDINNTSKSQYNLEKQSYLGATIIKYIFAIKLPLFLFFIFTLDKVSAVLTGAMCAAGVVDATPYGAPIFILKIVNIYIFGFWLLLHFIDTKDEKLSLTKVKFGFFLVAYFILLTEIILELVMFNSIEIDKMVSCCGTLYSNSGTSYISSIFLIENSTLLTLFYGNFLLILLFYFLRKKYLFTLVNLSFIIISLIALIVFFGTYIYELPTHHCPFCFLQKDYGYVGYLIYTTLFIGTFNGIATGFVDRFKLSIFFNTLFTLIVSFYPLRYYIENGVWL